MKRVILTSICYLLTAAFLHAQSDKFQTAMSSTLQEYDAAKDAPSLIAV